MGRWFELGLLLLAVPCLALPVADWLDAANYQNRLGRRLDRLASRVAEHDAAPNQPAATTADPEGSLDGLVGRLEIPRVGLSAIVTEGTDSRTLRRAVGHLPGTALPGDAGNVVLAGHRDTFFRLLRDVRPRDLVRITTPLGVFDYEVAEVSIVPPDDVDVLSQAKDRTLTLITCYPFHYIGPAPRRFIVHARPVSCPREAAS